MFFEIIRGYGFVYLYLHFFIIIHNHFSVAWRGGRKHLTQRGTIPIYLNTTIMVGHFGESVKLNLHPTDRKKY